MSYKPKKKKSLYIRIKSLKSNDKEKMLKATGGGGTNYTKNKRKMSIADLPSDNV